MQSIDLSQWSERSLKRFKSLLDRERDAELFPDLALSAEECRELELFRLGGAERRPADAPPPLIRMAYANGILVVVERTIVDPVEEDTPPPRTITPDPPASIINAPIDVAPPSTSEPRCEFCCGRCVGQDHADFITLHWLDPTEIARRDREATQLMLHMIPFGHHGCY